MRTQYSERRTSDSKRRMDTIASTRVPTPTSSGKLGSFRNSLRLGSARKQ